MRRPSVNITPLERAGRVLLGLVGIVGGVVLLGSGGGALAVTLEVLLVLAGMDLAVTGALGHCPLYAKLGHTAITEEARMSNLDTQHSPQQDQGGGHSGHGWMMMLCCIPMLVIAVVLVATGVVGAGFIFIAIMCTVMMAMMMSMMSGGGAK